MRVLSKIPFLTLAALVFNFVLLSNTAAFDPRSVPLFSLGLPSGAFWYASAGSFVMMLGTVLLVFDIIRSQRNRTPDRMDPVFSLVLLAALLIEFLFWKPAGNSTAILLIVMVLVNAATAFLAAPPATRRDFGISGIH